MSQPEEPRGEQPDLGAHWRAFVAEPALEVVSDFDGTLLPFASTPAAAAPDPELVALVGQLAASPGVRLTIVSGRDRDTLARYFGEIAHLRMVAEHGGWFFEGGRWSPALDPEASLAGELEALLEELAAEAEGTLVERKGWSATLHYRRVDPREKEAFCVRVDTAVRAWLRRHRDHECLEGNEVIEVRPKRMTKAAAIAWTRASAPDGARLLVFGDDVTDEDMFQAAGERDATVHVHDDDGRSTAARWRLPDPSATRTFLWWLTTTRAGLATAAEPSEWPAPVEPDAHDAHDAPGGAGRYELLVVSNRLPDLGGPANATRDRKKNVGGMVAALDPVLRETRAVWLGWSGRTRPEGTPVSRGLDARSKPALARLDYPEDWHQRYYNGLCNGALWPLFHSFPQRMRVATEDWQAYRDVNQAFAESVARLVGPDGTVWAHDYHLLLFARALRALGHGGRVGHFLHVPFPAADLLALFPWADELVEGMLEYDLLGFHTDDHAANFAECARRIAGATVRGDEVTGRSGRSTRVRAFPIGLFPEAFEPPSDAEAAREVEAVLATIRPAALVLGVDRLDYTKGIPERMMAFGRLLERHPEWRKKVALVQISVPSRADVPEYAEERSRIEAIVGNVNGEFGEADWTPIRYLYRSYDRAHLTALYRAARVGYVTPLRDGMNLVAKEYVAAQDPEDPGVLVLSRFAGAANELGDAVLTNPWHPEGMADDLDRALRLDLAERRRRHGKLLAAVKRTTALTWGHDFLGQLLAQGDAPASAAALSRGDARVRV